MTGAVGKRRVVILGATGSVGRQAIDVIRAHSDLLEVIGLAAGSDERGLQDLAAGFPGVRTGLGRDAALDLAQLDDADLVLNAVVGAAGLEASVAALSAGKILALANKESLVAGGRVCLEAARSGGATIVPVDSEHAALAQCLAGCERSSVAAIVLTASGGPFRLTDDLDGITPEDALAHPTWDMGPKITVDSATLVNKGLEVIEAHFLFGLDYDAIEVVVHPQSVVHGMVRMRDGSLVMQAAPTDMRIPIQAALLHPIHQEGPVARMGAPGLGLPALEATLPNLTFEPLDNGRFPAVRLAYDAGRAGRTYPAALNAANEVAVAAFLKRRLEFTAIVRVVQDVLDTHEPRDDGTLDAVLDADRDARRAAEEAMKVSAR